MLWRDFGGGGGITFTRSTDDGLTWGGRQVLDAAAGQGAWVTVGSDHTVYAFWLKAAPNRIVLRKSTDGGLTFGAVTTAATAWPDGNEYPVVANSGSGGLGRAYALFMRPKTISDVITARTKASSCTHMRRHASNRMTATRNGQFTYALPVRARTFAAQMSAAGWNWLDRS